MSIIIILLLLVFIYFIYLFFHVRKNKEERIKNNLLENNIDHKKANKINIFYLATASMMIALGAVLKIYGIMITDQMRISLFAIPLMLSGLVCGMELGIVTAIGADLTYSIFSGYAFNPAFTISAVYWGILGGIFHNLRAKGKLSIIKIILGILIVSLLETHTNLIVTYILYGTFTTIASLITKYIILLVKLPILSAVMILINYRVINKIRILKV